MNGDRLEIFALNESRDLAGKIAAHLDLELAEHEERNFEDGEHKIRSLVNIRGKDVFVIQSLYSDFDLSTNDKLCRLLFFIGALKDAAAERVTVVLPYLCYSRKDRKTKSRDPITTRYIAQLFESMGVDRVVTLDVHNPVAFQNAFRCPTEHLEGHHLMADHFKKISDNRALVVVSPDIGGAKRVEKFRQVLSRQLRREIGSAFLEKYRSAGEVSGEAIVGEVEGKIAIILDDLISTGGTLVRAARTCLREGAKEIHALATHGIFVGDADQVLADEPLANW